MRIVLRKIHLQIREEDLLLHIFKRTSFNNINKVHLRIFMIHRMDFQDK